MVGVARLLQHIKVSNTPFLLVLVLVSESVVFYFIILSRLDYVMDRVKGGFGVHYWNHRYTVEGNLSIPMESDHPLYSVMAENCPSTEQRVLRRRLGEPY